MVVAVGAPVAVAAEFTEAQRCVGEESAAEQVLDANMTPRSEAGPAGPEEPVITQGTPLVLTGPAPAPVTFTVAAQLPAGYALPPLVGKYRAFGPTPALPAELAGGVGTASPEPAGHVPGDQLYTFTSLAATTIPRTIYYQAFFQYGPTVECPNSHFNLLTQIHAVTVVARAPAEATGEQKPPPPPPANPSCTVPALRGHSLKAVKDALRRNHCRLGRVTLPHDRKHARVVVRQSRKPGTRLPQGAKVAITLGEIR